MTHRSNIGGGIRTESGGHLSRHGNAACLTATGIAAAICVMLVGMSSESPGQSAAKTPAAYSTQAMAHARFGFRIDAHDDWAVIAGPFEGVEGRVAVGRVYMYSAKQGWQQVQVIGPPDAQAVLTFGMSVSLSDDMLAVGAPGDHDGELMSGAVYIYRRNGTVWEFTEKILSPEPVFGGRFGGAVDLSANVLVVGAFRAFGSAEKSGSVYVFERDTSSWRFVKELFPLTFEPDEAFGTLVQVLDDSTIAVGRSMSDPTEVRREAVSVFSRREGAWLQRDLAVLPGGTSDLVGTALASNDRFVAVGVPGRTVKGIRTGSVFIYDRTTLLPLLTIDNPKTSELAYFGGSLAMTGSRLYVGCVRLAGEGRTPTGMVAGYDLTTPASGPDRWYPLDDQEGFPHSCPQVGATDSIVLASSPFGDVDGIVDAGMARFFPVSGVVGAEDPALPFEYALEQNYPNPFNAMTRINFSLKAAGWVRLELFNILGQRVSTLADMELKEGRHFVSFDAKRLASGVYFYRMLVNEFVALKKMLLVK